MTTIAVTTHLVLVDTRHTWQCTSQVQSKVSGYRGFLYTASGDSGAGQLDFYRFIDELLDPAKPWPKIEGNENVNASYVLVITSDVGHRDLNPGDVLCIDMVSGTVSHSRCFNEFQAVPGHTDHVPVYTAGSGGALMQTFMALENDPVLAFERAVETDPYSGFPYHMIIRSTGRVTVIDRPSGPKGFDHLRNVAGKSLGPAE